MLHIWNLDVPPVPRMLDLPNTGMQMKRNEPRGLKKKLRKLGINSVKLINYLKFSNDYDNKALQSFESRSGWYSY